MLESYLTSVFRKYKVENFAYPLFYCFPYGLRFEIAVDDQSATSLSRAEKVFSAAFAKGHEMLLVFEGKIGERLQKKLSALEHEEIPAERYDSETGEFTVYTRYIYKALCHELPHTVLLDEIIRHPESYQSEVFWMDCETGVMMMLYDERVCDLASPDPKHLAPVYQQLKSMLSIPDLPQMKLNFE